MLRSWCRAHPGSASCQLCVLAHVVTFSVCLVPLLRHGVMVSPPFGPAARRKHDDVRERVLRPRSAVLSVLLPTPQTSRMGAQGEGPGLLWGTLDREALD